MSVFQALGDFVKSIFELFYSFFQTAFDLVATIVTSIFSFLSSIVNVFLEFFKGILDVVGGLGHFVLANAVVILIVAAGGFGYLQYQKRQGQPVVVQGKKLN
ncbi:hypothetical protein EJ08DRAFT_652509 [Tothia fuscella]|uniref:Uncharacterized protein n=1 Tax=Tothia fuscella TaxID=1048955 RepID=A0A9P4NKA9_9PEZI|nr:hypothetical protein EJ08DRAFT_652509 [Tothia fuscella]